MNYYKTRTGLFYKQLANGSKVRVSANEFKQNGGAVKKSTSKTAVVPEIRYTKAEQECIDKAEAIVAEYKKEVGKGSKYPFNAAAVAAAYEEARKKYPECLDFYDREKVRKAQLKEAKKALSKKRKRKRTKSKRKIKSKAKKSTSKKSTSKSKKSKSKTKKSKSKAKKSKTKSKAKK